nr:50S ribosomal protein L24e [Nanoarchaeum sp.]
MVRCSFCNKSIEPGTGKMFVLVTGKVLYFCSNKCEKNMIVLKRNPVDWKWASKEDKK